MVSPRGSRITIEQLLHHTSGLPADYDAPAFNATAAGAAHSEPQPFVQKFCQTDLAADPGTKWQYSNCGYDILGLILEEVTGVSYEYLLRTKILDPAGMCESGLDGNDLVLPNRALGYQRHLGPTYTAGPHLDLSHVFAAGAMYSTPEDLLRWNQVLSSDTLFSKRIRDQMFRPGLGNWGYGWFVTTIPAGQPGAGSVLAEMRGDMPGNFFSSISRFAAQDAVIIVLRNGYGSSERLEANLQAVLYGQRPHLPMPKPGDLLVHSFQLSTGWACKHAFLSLLAIVVALSWVVLHPLTVFAVGDSEQAGVSHMPTAVNLRMSPAAMDRPCRFNSPRRLLRKGLFKVPISDWPIADPAETFDSSSLFPQHLSSRFLL